MYCAWPGDYHSLGLTRIQFHPPKVTPRIHSDEVTVKGVSYRNSSAWGWHNSHQSGVVSITNKLILQNEKSYRRNNNGPKTQPCGTPDTTLTSLLRHPSTKTNCDLLYKNCVSTDNTEPRYPQSWAYREFPDGWPYQKQRWSRSAQSWPPASSPMHSAVYVTHTKAHHRYPNLSDKQTVWLEAHHSVP